MDHTAHGLVVQAGAPAFVKGQGPAFTARADRALRFQERKGTFGAKRGVILFQRSFAGWAHTKGLSVFRERGLTQATDGGVDQVDEANQKVFEHGVIVARLNAAGKRPSGCEKAIEPVCYSPYNKANPKRRI